MIGLWLTVGFLTLIGTLCYAELGSSYPEEGGDYAYLTRAFGRRMGFLFAWAQLWIVRPGSIGAMAYVLATYANRIGQLWAQFAVGRPGSLWARPYPAVSHLIGILHLPTDDKSVTAFYAAGSVVLLTVVNLLGIRLGKWTQNLLTVVKMLGLLAIVAVGLCAARSTVAVAPAAPASASLPLVLGLILVFYAYSGWNEMAYVGAEVRNPAAQYSAGPGVGHGGHDCRLPVDQPGLRASPGFCRPAAFQRRGRRRAGLRGRTPRRVGHQPADLHLGAGRDQRHDLHRIAASTMPWDANTPCTAGWENGTNGPEPPLASLLVQGVITVGLVLVFGLWQERPPG